MHHPQLINNRFSSRIGGAFNLPLLCLRLVLILLCVVGSGTPD